MNKDIWDDQFVFNKQFFKDLDIDLENLSVTEKVQWSKEFFFHVSKELADLVECLPHWKMHYKNEERMEEDIISSNIVEEYVDVLKYFMGLGQVLGIDYKQIIEGYQDKTEVVKQKYEQNKKFKELQNKDVVIFDIDGVINNYPYCFLDWLTTTKNLPHIYETMEQLKSELSVQQYEHLKTEYRLSRQKKFQPINMQTVILMNHLKEQGETIVLFTNRPVTKYKVIYTDTLYWLTNGGIPFDAIYWSDYQQKEDIYRLKFKIKFIVEDSLENAKNFNREKHVVFLLNKEHNQDNFYKNPLLFRVKCPMDILKYNLKNLDSYKHSHEARGR
jgi:hypothetical protein